jgi:hypothetical protein
MPRPVKEDPRDCFKTFRFTQAEASRLEGRARASGRTVSSYVRFLLLDRDGGGEASSPAHRGSPHPQERRQRILAEQMRKVGVNLNQIARRMNEQRIPPPRELTMVLDEIRTYVRQVQEP